MNSTAGDAGTARDLRVRDQVREVCAVVAFTAAACGLASLSLLLLGTVGR